MSSEILSTQEKVDAIYDMLKSQERRRKTQLVLWWTVRFIMIGALAYLYLHPEIVADIKKHILEQYVYPEVSRITSDIITTQQNSLKEKGGNLLEDLKNSWGQ